MEAMIKIGVDHMAVKEAHAAIRTILTSKVDQATMQVALETLTKITSVNGTSITGCQFETAGRK